MVEHNFRVEFGESWKKYSEILRESASAVVSFFRGTSLEKNMDNFYELAVPRKKESPMSFFSRNERLSYYNPSAYHRSRMESDIILARILWLTGKIPFLNKAMCLKGCSTELYLGQETKGYVSRDDLKGARGIGTYRVIVSNCAEPMDLDIDVGFVDKGKRNWFYQINVFDSSLVKPATMVHQMIQTKLKEIENGTEI